MDLFKNLDMTKHQKDEKVSKFQKDYSSLSLWELHDLLKITTQNIKSLWPQKDDKNAELMELFCRRTALYKNHEAILATFPPSIQAGFQPGAGDK